MNVASDSTAQTSGANLHFLTLQPRSAMGKDRYPVLLYALPVYLAWTSPGTHLADVMLAKLAYSCQDNLLNLYELETICYFVSFIVNQRTWTGWIGLTPGLIV